MSQPAASQATQQKIAELTSEIAFQKVLLSSIDDSVENRGDAEEEVRAEIKHLEKQLKALRRGSKPASSSQATSSTQLVEASHLNPSPYTDRPNTAMDELAAGRAKAREPRQYLEPASSTSSTPNSADSLLESLTPSRMSLPNRKRSYSKHMDGGFAPFEDNKSRRTSPSPYMTGPTTPSTSSGYGYDVVYGDGHFGLTVDDEFESFDREFFQQQRMEEERIKREQLDAEFARSIQNDNSLDTLAMSPPARSGPSAFDRISGVRPPASSSASAKSSRPSSSRTLPWATSRSASMSFPVKSEPRSATSKVKREPTSTFSNTGFSSYGSHPNKIAGLKSDPSPSRTMPGAFRDDSSDASDSDIQIIPPEAFHDNGRRNISPSKSRYGVPGNSMYGNPHPKIQRQSYSPETQYAGHATLRRGDQATTASALQMAMYGDQLQNGPSWMDGNVQASVLPANRLPMSVPGSYPNAGSKTPSILSGGNGIGNAGPSSGHGGVYAGHPGRDMHYAASRPGSTLDNVLGGVIGKAFNINQPLPLQGLGSINNPSAISRFANLASGDSMSEIFNQPFSEQMGAHFDYIMNDPRKTNDEIKELLENIRPDTELPIEDREGTPDGLKYPLYEHQKLALTWLKSMEEGTNKGGILADDMGLGKTISSLALILSRPSTDRLRKTTLIVGPVALVRQWEREIRQKVNSSHKLSTYMVHGQGRKLSWDELRNYDVVLTTYGTLGAELKRREKFEEKMKLEGHARDYDQAPMNKLFPLLGPKSKFYRVILDEAQYIKNKTTNSARAACNLQAMTRFCLTGTPMMNNVGELYSLIHFLRIKPYNEWQRFQDAFGMLTRGDASKRTVQGAMRKLQAVLKAILLRRTKESLIDGKPIINLPPKTEEIQHVVFSPEEQEFYNALESKTQIQFNKYMRANTIGKNYSNILVLLLRLRQCCCHPHLITDFDEAPTAGVDLSVDAMMELARTLAPDVVGRLLAAEAFECPVCYDGVENPKIVIPCGHDTCAECLSKIADQANQQNAADGNEASGATKCPTCRGKVELNKVIDYTTFKKVHKPDALADNETAIVDTNSTEDESETDFDSESEGDHDTDNNGNLRGFIVPDDIDETDDEDSAECEDGDDEAEAAPKKRSNFKSKKGKGEKRRRKVKEGKKKEDKSKHISLAMLKKEASRSAEGRRKYMRYLRKHWQPSAKVDKCVELLEQFQKDGQKTIIFSQFVSLLDLLQVPIDQKGWKCERYDGSMNSSARNDAIVRFTDNPNTRIMLISLKAGNAGLNLVAASRVIILDPFWNPFIEMQAVDRAYRIGQQRSVEVHRILIEKTVEDRIIELQERKRKLVNSALDEGASQSLGRLSVRQLAYLFGVGDNSDET